MVDEKRVNGNVVQKYSGYTGKYLHPENGIELCWYAAIYCRAFK
ncbi:MULTISPECIES: hypothetical protein [Ferroplasma]|jgi:hypothetical protein|uniref:Uncharacterized protein n=1 Tax=Ferroplasma acidarmanus Fer1 TaxID=333146 RepID=S0AR11_FERAC|nr:MULTISPECIES: hypothetical protein [Ferroplasma]AGO60530.1 hypothetical protein FACI_IFERC00001G0550 [Ferroplasma acidarmanus Fer1]